MKWKRYGVWLSIVVIIMAAWGSLSAQAVDFVPLDPANVTAPCAVLMDLHTGELLWKKEADKRVFPASTTKIMTALLALEQGDINETVTCTDEVNNIDSTSTRMYINPGEVVSLENLLYGLMLPSGNDAAMAIAIHIGGSLPEFVAMMNQRAIDLGMSGTHYENPHGLHGNDHYTTAADMAKLAYEAMKIPEFRAIVSAAEHVFPATNLSDRSTRRNNNFMVDPQRTEYYKDCIGIKTGYTSQAGGCLVSAGKRGDTELCALIFKDDQSAKFTTAATMLEYGFSNYSTVNLTEKLTGQPVVVRLPNAAFDDQTGGEVALVQQDSEPVYFTDTKAEIEKLLNDLSRVEVRYDPPLEELRAPLSANRSAGTATYVRDGEELLTTQLLAPRAVEARGSSFAPLVDLQKRLKMPLWGFSPLSAILTSIGLIVLGFLVSIGVKYVRYRFGRRRR